MSIALRNQIQFPIRTKFISPSMFLSPFSISSVFNVNYLYGKASWMWNKNRICLERHTYSDFTYCCEVLQRWILLFKGRDSTNTTMDWWEKYIVFQWLQFNRNISPSYVDFQTWLEWLEPNGGLVDLSNFKRWKTFLKIFWQFLPDFFYPTFLHLMCF